MSSVDTNRDISTVMEADSGPHILQSPLDINCELAIDFIEGHLQSQNVNINFDFSILTSLSNNAFLGKIAEMMLVPELTDCIAIAFFPILSDLVGRWAILGEEHREKIACALGRLVHVEPKLKRYNIQSLKLTCRHMQELLLREPSFLRVIASLTPETPPELLREQFPVLNFPESADTSQSM